MQSDNTKFRCVLVSPVYKRTHTHTHTGQASSCSHLFTALWLKLCWHLLPACSHCPAAAKSGEMKYSAVLLYKIYSCTESIIYQTRQNYFFPPPLNNLHSSRSLKEMARRILRLHARSAISAGKGGTGKNKALFVCGGGGGGPSFFIPALPSCCLALQISALAWMDTGGLCWPCSHCLHPLRSAMQINPKWERSSWGRDRKRKREREGWRVVEGEGGKNKRWKEEMKEEWRMAAKRKWRNVCGK